MYVCTMYVVCDFYRYFMKIKLFRVFFDFEMTCYNNLENYSGFCINI